MLRLNHIRLLWMVLILALSVRVGWAVALQIWLNGQPGRLCLIEGDAYGYWHLAEDLATGRDYAIYEPPRRVLRMPGFPALLSIPMRLFEAPMMPVRLMLAGVGTLACGLVYVLGRRLFDKRVGLIAAALAAISPSFIVFTPLLLSETLFATCLLISLIAMARMVQADEGRLIVSGQTENGFRKIVGTGRLVGSALLVGALIGGVCYVRPSWLLSAPLFGGAYVVWSTEKAKAVLAAVCVVAGAVGVLVPWGLRNQRVTGHFVLTTLWMGPSLYDGLRPDANGDSDMRFFDQDNLMARGMSEYEVNEHYAAKARAFVRANPGRAFQLAAIKLWRYFKLWPNAEQFGGWGPALIMAAYTIPVFAFAAFGAWTQRHNFWGLALTLGPLFYFAVLHAIFVSSLRYRLPAEYPLLIMTAAGLRSWRPR